MNSTLVTDAPDLRFVTLADYDRMAELETANGLYPMPPEGWRRMWLENPLWPRVGKNWPLGWLLEDANGCVVGSLVNVPTLYTFRGQELVCAVGRAWVVAPEFRGFALWLLAEYFDQPHVDVFVNNTVAAVAQPFHSEFAHRVPVGDFETVAYWITGYRGFAKKALQKLHVPAASLFALPAATGLWLKDKLSAKSLPPASTAYIVNHPDTFDDRFDIFWRELVEQNPERLLAFRDRNTLSWHFDTLEKAGKLWVITATRNGLLRAYGIFKRQDRGDGIRRMQLVDYQTVESETDLLPTILRSALQRSARENMYVLEQIGCGLPNRASVDRHAPYRRKLPNWPFFYKATDPTIDSKLSDPQCWEPSMFDGDGSFD